MNQVRNIVATLECFVVKNDKILMLHRSKNKKIMPDIWMAPGGHREHNEGLFACARREVFEETGLEIKNIQIRATGNAYIKDLDREFYFHFVRAEYKSGILKPKIDDGEFKWLTITEILKLPNLLLELYETLHHVLSNDPKVISFCAEYENSKKMTMFEIEDS